MTSSWWVCSTCKDGPCHVLRAKEPDDCLDAEWPSYLAEWQEATPEDMAEIAKNANDENNLLGNVSIVPYRGWAAGCGYCDLEAKAKRLHVCIRGQSMEYRNCGYRGPTND